MFVKCYLKSYDRFFLLDEIVYIFQCKPDYWQFNICNSLTTFLPIFNGLVCILLNYPLGIILIFFQLYTCFSNIALMSEKLVLIFQRSVMVHTWLVRNITMYVYLIWYILIT